MVESKEGNSRTFSLSFTKEKLEGKQFPCEGKTRTISLLSLGGKNSVFFENFRGKENPIYINI